MSQIAEIHLTEEQRELLLKVLENEQLNAHAASHLGDIEHFLEITRLIEVIRDCWS